MTTPFPVDLADPGLSGCYFPAQYAMHVQGMDAPSPSADDQLTNSILLHEFCHHLQFAATTAGWTYISGLRGVEVQMLRLAAELASAAQHKRIPRTLGGIAAAVDRLQVEALTEQYQRIRYEIDFRDSWLGWPRPAPEATTLPVTLTDSRGMLLENLNAGMLLIAEGHARSHQMHYLLSSGAEEQDVLALTFPHQAVDSPEFQEYFRIYRSLYFGFRDSLSIVSPVECDLLFAWCCVKAMMPPITPAFATEMTPAQIVQATLDWHQSIGSEDLFPGARYKKLWRLLVEDRNLLRRCLASASRADYLEIDRTLSTAAGWQLCDQVVDSFEGGLGGSKGVHETIAQAAVACHRQRPWVLGAPRRAQPPRGRGSSSNQEETCPTFGGHSHRSSPFVVMAASGSQGGSMTASVTSSHWSLTSRCSRQPSRTARRSDVHITNAATPAQRTSSV